MRKHKRPWLKIAVHVAALAPLAVLAGAYWQRRLGPDPIGEVIRRTGRYAIVLLLLSLVPTAVKTLAGFAGLLRVRRALGLYAFAYAALHFAAFAWLDYGLNLPLIAQAIIQGRRTIVGLVALLLLIPLALTSTSGWVKRLGKNWQRLHRLTYLASALTVLHYLWSFKEPRPAPIAAGVALLLLLVARIPAVARFLGQRRSP